MRNPISARTRTAALLAVAAAAPASSSEASPAVELELLKEPSTPNVEPEAEEAPSLLNLAAGIELVKGVKAELSEELERVRGYYPTAEQLEKKLTTLFGDPSGRVTVLEERVDKLGRRLDELADLVRQFQTSKPTKPRRSKSKPASK